MRKLGFSVLSLIIATVAACGGGSTSSTAEQTSSEAGPGTEAGPDSGPALSDGSTAEASIAAPPANGTVGGHSFSFAHGIATPRTVGGGQGYEIFLSDKPIDCTNATLESATTIDIDVAGQPPPAGSYPVINPNAASPKATEASSDFNVEDATCGSVLSDASLSGTLTLTGFDAAKVSGSFEITFQNKAGASDGSVAGRFEAIVCPKFPTLTCT